jgi:hypothetical protein
MPPILTLRPIGDRNAPPGTVAPAETPAEPLAPLVEEAANWPTGARLSSALHRARAKAFLEQRRRRHRQDAP